MTIQSNSDGGRLDKGLNQVKRIACSYINQVSLRKPNSWIRGLVRIVSTQKKYMWRSSDSKKTRMGGG